MSALLRGTPTGLGAWFWSLYARRALRRTFRGVWLRGPRPSPSQSALFYANHRGYWDAFASQAVITQHLRFEGYGAMAHENLQRYPFLRHLGAFSLQRGDGRATLETFRYAKGLLRRPGVAVLLFPEGELRPNAPAPLTLSRGLETLGRLAGVPCVPVAFRYAFFEAERPDLLVELGAPHAPGALSTFSAALDGLVQRLDAVTSPLAATAGFEQILGGSSSPSERWRAYKERRASPAAPLLESDSRG